MPSLGTHWGLCNEQSPVLTNCHAASSRMVQRREHLRLTAEAVESVRNEGDTIGKDLEGDVAVQPRVVGTVDLSHAALAK